VLAAWKALLRVARDKEDMHREKGVVALLEQTSHVDILPTQGLGMLCHALTHWKLRHRPLEAQIQERVLQMKAELPPVGIETYLLWVSKLDAPNVQVLDAMCKEICDRRAEFTPVLINGCLKAISSLSVDLPNPFVVLALVKEFVNQRDKLRADEHHKVGRMGEYCRIAARLGIFSPDLARDLQLSSYCTWGAKTMTARDVNGILTAYRDMNLTIPDDLEAVLVARLPVIAPTLDPRGMCDLLYNIGRPGQKPLKVDSKFVASIVHAINSNGPQLKHYDLARALAAGSQVHVGKNPWAQLCANLQNMLATNQSFRRMDEFLLTLEALASMQKQYPMIMPLRQALFKNVKQLARVFRGNEIIRCMRAFALLPRPPSRVAWVYFSAKFTVDKFENGEEFVEFQNALQAFREHPGSAPQELPSDEPDAPEKKAWG